MLYLVFLYLFGVYVFRDKISERLKVGLLLLPLLIIVWTRYGIGVDYFSYQDMYTKIDPQNITAVFTNYRDVEIGYKLLMVPFRALQLPYIVFLGVLNSTVTILFYKWIKDNSSNEDLSMLLFYAMFFFVWVLSAMRQSIVLSISLYLLFNQKKSLSLTQSIILIITLGFFHKSAYFLFIYLLARHISWTKKKHIYLMVASILVTFLPFEKLLGYISFIPSISKIMDNYINVTIKFYDFPGIIRLLIFVAVILFYDKIPSKKREADTLLFGTSLYFLLKFSELTAARGTIFSFFMIIVIIPDIINYLEKYNKTIIRVVITVSIFVGSSLYFTKEFNSMFDLAQYLQPVTKLTYPNIFNKDIDDFGSLYSYEVDLYQNVHAEYDSYKSNYNHHEKVYDDSQSYQPSLINNKYFMIGQDGSFIPDLESDYYMSILDGILVETYYRDSYFYTSKLFTDLRQSGRTEEEMTSAVADKSFSHTVGYEEERIAFDYHDLPEVLKSFFPNESAVNDLYANKVYDESGMVVVRIVYHKKVSYMYLNEDLEPLLDFPTKQLRKYNEYNFFNVDVYGKTITLNLDGEIIQWR